MTSLAALVESLRGGQVRMLLVLGGNPGWKPAGRTRLFRRVAPAWGIGGSAATGWSRPAHDAPLEVCVHLGLYEDETSELAHWHIPRVHYLEAWSDARAYDGTVSHRSAADCAALRRARPRTRSSPSWRVSRGRCRTKWCRNYWRDRLGREQFATGWRKMVHDGWLADSQSPEHEPEWTFTDRLDASPRSPRRTKMGCRSPTVCASKSYFWRIRAVADGRFANNGWLQELPRPLTKLTWDNAALAQSRNGQRLGARRMATWSSSFAGGGTVPRSPSGLHPGQADDCISVIWDTAAAAAARSARPRIQRVSQMPASARPWVVGWRHGTKTGRRLALVATHEHWQHGGSRPGATVDKLRQVRGESRPSSSERRSGATKEDQPNRSTSRLPAHPARQTPWGMAIDQTACIGCNACVVACQAENNIPIVGKEQVRPRPRDALDARSTAITRGTMENPETYFQPVPCMHCENAPCELVCPVGATVHRRRGAQQYGLQPLRRHARIARTTVRTKCGVSTSSISADIESTEAEPASCCSNPEVTVRSRGVMEKCTYCVQRIDAARIDAKKRGSRRSATARLQTACQAVCPTAGDRVRQSATTRQQPGRQAASIAAELRPARRAEHPAADVVSGPSAQSESAMLGRWPTGGTATDRATQIGPHSARQVTATKTRRSRTA